MRLREEKGFDRFGLFVQDYGGPVGFRIVTRKAAWLDCLIIQNTNHPEHKRTRSDSQVPRIQFGTVRFNDKPEARYKCSPGWERFTIHLDIAKLNTVI